MSQPIRNVAIIAHVDHGKTTLLDVILKHCSSITEKETKDRIMDSNDQERERGITIFSKNTAVNYNGSKINVVDTPGHSDFGGEVERVLRMVDGCLLLVDAHEGPMPQTRFVLKKALELGHKIILVINKIDKPSADPDRVIEQTMELFMELDATDEQIEFPIIYASAKNGFAKKEMADEDKDISPLLDCIIENVNQPKDKDKEPFVFQVTTLDYNDYLGRICIGRIFAGVANVNQQVLLVGHDEQGNETRSKHKITKLFNFHGLQRAETESAMAGDIVAIAGIAEMTIGDSLCDVDDVTVLPRIEIEPPTISMEFKVNDSPLCGREGKYLTSRQIRERLFKEVQTNLSLKVEQVGEFFKVSGRGELHLAILIETMRREGYELGVSKPQVILKDVDGVKSEPYEEIVMDMPESFTGGVIQELNRRKGTMTHMENISDEFQRIKYEMPTRGLIGFRSFYLTETRGNGTMAGIYLGYRPYSGDFSGRKRGAIVSMTNGTANGYALMNAQTRGDLFIGAQTTVYEGMIIGENSKEMDLDINPIKEKKLTNVRASGTDEAIKLTPFLKMTLEQCLDFLEDDEILEITPSVLRLRKKVLQATMRKKGSRKNS